MKSKSKPRSKPKSNQVATPPKKTELTEDEKNSLFYDLSRHGRTNVSLIANWCGNLSHLSEEILKSKSVRATLEEGMFWIRLWAVVVDLHNRYSETVKSGVANGFAVSVHKAIQQIRAKLTEEDLIVLDYLRQTNCHILQSGYQKGINESKTGVVSLKNQYLVQTIPKKMALDDINTVLNVRMKKFGADQTAIAKDFARRINMDLEALWQITSAEARRKTDR